MYIALKLRLLFTSCNRSDIGIYLMTMRTGKGRKIDSVLMRSIHCPVGTYYLPFGFDMNRAGNLELTDDSAADLKEILRLNQHTGQAYIVGYAEELDLILLAGHFHPQGHPAASHKLHGKELTDRLDQLQRLHRPGQQGICTATLKAFHVMLIVIAYQYQHELR